MPGAIRVAQGQEATAEHALQLQGLWTNLVQVLPKEEHLGADAREAVQNLQDAFENKPDPELLPDAEGGPEEQRKRQAEVQCSFADLDTILGEMGLQDSAEALRGAISSNKQRTTA